MTLYALYMGGMIGDSRILSYHESVDGAKKRAQEELDRWWGYWNESTPRERDETEPMITRELSWEMMFHYIHAKPKPVTSENDDRARFTTSPWLTAFYSKDNYFYIRELEVGP